jgi:hypothetical protein
MRIGFFLMISALLMSSPAQAIDGCMQLQSFMSLLLKKPDLKKLNGTEAMIQDAAYRFRRNIEFQEVLGEPLSAKLAPWRMEFAPIETMNGSSTKIKVFNRETGEQKWIDLKLNRTLHEEEVFFDGLKVGPELKLSKDDVVNVGDRSVRTLDFQESILSALLFHAKPRLLKEKAIFFQNAIYELSQARRIQKVLKGEIPLQHAKDLFDGPLPLSWSKLSKRASSGSGLQALEEATYQGISYARLTEAPGMKKIEPGEAFDLFLTKTRSGLNREKQGIEDFTYGFSFSYEDAAGKSLNFHYLRPARIERTTRGNWVPDQWVNAPHDIREYIRKSYAKDLNLTKAQLDRLIEISEEMQPRTEYLFMTEEPYAFSKPKMGQRWDPITQGWVDVERRERTNFKHFSMKGSMSMVFSSSETEKLPLELFTGVKIARPAEGKVVEIGRFYVDPDLRPIGPMQIWKAASLAASQKGVGKICAETTKEYAEKLIHDFGFTKVAERLNFEGKAEYIIEVTPEVFLKNSALRPKS